MAAYQQMPSCGGLTRFLRFVPWGWLLAILPALAAQSVLADPQHFWQYESAYAGSKACQSCHAEIYRNQEASNHALSLRPAAEVPQLTSGLPIERTDRASDSILRLTIDAERRLRLSARKDAESGSARLEWAFGSGVKGITPAGRIDAGQFVESRLTWYASLAGFDFTTGASKYDPRTAAESLGRQLSEKQIAECFGCHTTGYDKQKQAPVRNEMGVRCERCHGPGREHIQAVAREESPAKHIFHPGRMEAFPQVQMCGACHGAPPQDNDFDKLRFIETTPITVRFPSQRLVLSRCFNESFEGLKCTQCHDPHRNAAETAAEHDASCRSCHGDGEQETAVRCPVSERNCHTCHMPTERVMRHSLFTDHWIRVVRGGGN